MLADRERRLALLRAEERPGASARSPRTRSIQPLPFGVVGKAPQAALMLNAMVFRHSKYPERREGLHPVHDGGRSSTTRG